jgi:hypothetical protein
LNAQRSPNNVRLRSRRLAVGKTEGQVAEEIVRLVIAETGREPAIDGNYVSKLERGIITWPNRAYRMAFRALFGAASDAELGFYASRTRRDAQELQAPWPSTGDQDGGTLSLRRARL